MSSCVCPLLPFDLVILIRSPFASLAASLSQFFFYFILTILSFFMYIITQYITSWG